MIPILRPQLRSDLQETLQVETWRVLMEYRSLRRSQSRFTFPSTKWELAEADARMTFHGKCAFCETLIPRGEGERHVEHFRPATGAMNLDKSLDRDHYFWLAYEWDNLYYSCSTCESNKRTFFPVKGERATVEGFIAVEQPLLVDPCRDDPDEHFSFLENGSVQALDERGEVTISLLSLNRPNLVADRRSAIESIGGRLDTTTSHDYLQDGFPYAAAMRHLVARHTGMSPQEVRWHSRAGDLDYFLDRGRRTIAMADAVAPPAAVPLAIPAPAPAPTPTPTHAGYLKSIRLHNFRGVDDVFLPIADPREGRPSWLMLLGENAAGKSSVLQAVGLALLGEKQLAKLEVDLDDLITNGRRSATIELETHADPPRIELHLKRGKKFEYAAGGEGYPGLVLGYGATRLSGKEVTKKKSGKSTDEKRILNLFDPRAELTPAQRWMRGLDETNFNAVATTLKDLLRLEDEDEFRIAGRRVKLNSGETLDQLSAGYRAILALGVDMMQASAEHVTQKNLISGVVLLDEIDAHLHPRWKMDVVRILRDAFPYVQFIASTHEPLCLRGLKDGEIVLMRRDDDDRVVAEMPLKSVEGLRVDQILTSPLFGLHTTLDPELDAKFRAYYDLLARRPEERTEEEERRLEALRAEVSRYGVLGYTRRDQMVYDIIDEFLAAGGHGEVSAETKQRVLNIWRRVDLWGQRDDPRPS